MMDPFVDGSYYTYAGDAAFLFHLLKCVVMKNHIFLMRFFMYIIMSYLQMNIIKVLIMR
jgi:hypothetical protein